MKKIFLACLLSSITLNALAEGPYVGAGITANRYDVNINLGSFINHKSSTSVGAKFFGGYELDQMWALEAGHADLGKVSTDWRFSGRNGTAKLTANSTYAAAKARASIHEQFALIGKLGVARSQFKLSGFPSGADETKTGLYAAIGSEFAINKQVNFSLAWERYGQSHVHAKSGSLTASLQVNF